MEIPVSAVTGAARVGIQIASNHRRPLLEVYHELRNVFSPPYEYRVPIGVKGDRTEKSSSRSQDIFVQFVLVNLGSIRAENVKLSFSGEFDRNRPRAPLRELELFGLPIPQLAPGQAVFLFRVDVLDLSRHPEGGGKSLGLKDETFSIDATYSGPSRGLNRIPRLWGRLRRGFQYSMHYTFNPKILRTDFPSPEYHG